MGHDLRSCTGEIGKFRQAYGDLVFVDTPGFGFDDVHSSKSDLNVLKMVDKWLKSTYVFFFVDHF